MLNFFKLKQIPFEFNNETFYCFDKKYIPYLIGKSGKQTAINPAGSLWIKHIHRNVNWKQAESDKINPKWTELFNFLQSHLSLNDALFFPNNSMIINEKIDEMILSTNVEDIKRLSEFLKFREIQIYTLIYFKEIPQYRKKILKLILDSKNNFRRDIPPQYIYILLTLYIAQTYSIFRNYDFKEFEIKIGLTNKEYIDRFFSGLKSNSKIINLTALCYTQFFWFDYRLSGSNHSEIHKILYNLFNDLQLS